METNVLRAADWKKRKKKKLGEEIKEDLQSTKKTYWRTAKGLTAEATHALAEGVMQSKLSPDGSDNVEQKAD